MPEQPEQQPAGDPYRAGFERISQLIVTTGTEVAGHDIVQYLAIVRGIVVRATSIGKGIVGSFKALGGGNIREFTESARPRATRPTSRWSSMRARSEPTR